MNNKLYVGNLNYNTTEQELTELFSQAGIACRKPRLIDDVAGRPAQSGLVELLNAEQAQIAIERFHNSQFHGRILKVNLAVKRVSHSSGIHGKS